MKSLLKFAIFTIVFGFLLSTPAQAQNGNIQPPTMEELGEEADPAQRINQTQYVNNHVQRTLFSGYCSIAGVTDPDRCAPNGNPISQGALAPIQTGIAYITSSPPVQTNVYIADLLHNSNFIAQPAYAQGIGFSGLSPILDLWKIFRNLSYLAFIFIFAIIGFFIMIRQRIDPQTVVSIQTALPKLVVTLIIITFSYAIAGLVIDLMYVSIYLIIAVFTNSGIVADSQQMLDNIFGLNIFSIGWRYFIGSGEVVGQGSQAVGTIIAQILDSPGLGDAAGVLFWLILAVAVLIALLRTFISLLSAYVGIILSTIFAPFTLLANAIPGSNTFTNWLKGLIANAALFPIIVVMLIIGAYLVGGQGGTDFGVAPIPNTNAGFVPPLLGGNTSNTGPQQIRALIGLGIILLIPEILNLVKERFQVQSQFGELAVQNAQRGWSGWGQIFGGVGTAVRTPFRAGTAALIYGRNISDLGDVYSRWRAGARSLSDLFPPGYGRTRTEREVEKIRSAADDVTIPEQPSDEELK